MVLEADRIGKSGSPKWQPEPLLPLQHQEHVKAERWAEVPLFTSANCLEGVLSRAAGHGPSLAA